MSSPENHIAIQQLVASYAYFMDTMQADKMAPLFLDDGVFDETGLGVGIFRGRAELDKFFHVVVEYMEYCYHFGGPHIINFSSEIEATGILYSISEGKAKNGGPTKAVYYYEDKYSKIGGDWKFVERKTIPLVPCDVSEFVNSSQKTEAR